MKEDYDEKLAQLCTFGNQKLILECINQGANVNYNHGFAGRLAISQGNFSTLKLLIKYGFDEFDEALVDATRHQKHDMMKFLIDKGANVHYAQEKCLSIAIKNEDFIAFDLLLVNKANCHIDHDKFLMSLLVNDNFSNLESIARKMFNTLLEKININTFDPDEVYLKQVESGLYYYSEEDLALQNLIVITDYVNAKKESQKLETMLSQIEIQREVELEKLGMTEEIEELKEEAKSKRRNKI